MGEWKGKTMSFGTYIVCEDCGRIECDNTLLKLTFENSTDNAFKLIQAQIEETDRVSDAQDYRLPLSDLWWANAAYLNYKLLQDEYEQDLNSF